MAFTSGSTRRVGPGSGHRSTTPARKQSSPWRFAWGGAWTWRAPPSRRCYRRLTMIVAEFQLKGKDLPKNTGGKEKKAQRLDCLVLNRLMDMLAGDAPTSAPPFQTIRCPFEEGTEAYPGAMIRVQS